MEVDRSNSGGFDANTGLSERGRWEVELSRKETA